MCAIPVDETGDRKDKLKFKLGESSPIPDSVKNRRCFPLNKFKEITVCLDMYGCPNRCKHCWLGATPNGQMRVSDLEFTANEFRPFSDCFEIYDWYREPDFGANYQELRKLCRHLSDKQTEHFELVSVWRLVRDNSYITWLSSLGLKAAQLTVFGDEVTTDYYTGRKGAYQEIVKAIDILIEHQISIRLQAFINQDNIDKLAYIENFIKELDLEARCQSFGGSFSFFLHQGSCDGENEKLYDIRVTPKELEKIHEFLKNKTLKHYAKKNLGDVFGKTEESWYKELAESDSVASFVTDTPVFYIDRNFDVYPNITCPSPHWCLGNLKLHGAEAVLENYIENRSLAQHTRFTVPLGDIVKSQADRQSQRLFTRDDYIIFLLNRYCRQQQISIS